MTTLGYDILTCAQKLTVRQSSLAYHGPRRTKEKKVKSNGRIFKKKKSEASVNAAAFSEETPKWR